jgi:formylglycine-generating enzyme required for sulfatase activity
MLPVATAPELFDQTLWSSATDERREAVARLVAGQVGGEFRYVGLRRYAGASAPVAVFEHASLGAFSLVPGGGFDMGLSPEEEATICAGRGADDPAADEFAEELEQIAGEFAHMRPLHRVVVSPFLIAQRPLTSEQARRWLPGFCDPLHGEDLGAAHLDPEQIEAVLAGSGLRLPSEAELEYAARGGLHRRPTPSGDRLPDEASLEAMLKDTDGSTHNAFGLHGYGLYPELCADHWHADYHGAPDDGSPWLGSGKRVVRGGAANYYPWQSCGEWGLMLCAMRLSEEAVEFGTALRLVYGLGEHEVGTKKSAKKAARTKTAAKKAVKKTATKKAAKTAPTKKTAAKKTAAKKAATKKVAKKVPAKKTTKTAAKKVAKRVPAKKTTKTAAKKTAAKKTAAKKKTAKKTASPKKTR